MTPQNISLDIEINVHCAFEDNSTTATKYAKITLKKNTAAGVCFREHMFSNVLRSSLRAHEIFYSNFFFGLQHSRTMRIIFRVSFAKVDP